MIEWFASHNGIEQLFLLSGIVGGVIILFQLILMIVGLDHHGTDVHIDSDAGFQALTIQGISSFFAMFGVVGYALSHGALLGALISIVGAFGAGVVPETRTRILSTSGSLMKLQTSGTISLYAAVGSEGSVYLSVGKDGGRVQINFANRLREFEAVSADGSTIPTGTPIRVQSVTGNTLVVAPADR